MKKNGKVKPGKVDPEVGGKFSIMNVLKKSIIVNLCFMTWGLGEGECFLERSVKYIQTEIKLRVIDCPYLEIGLNVLCL